MKLSSKTLNKLQRKIDLDALVPEWSELYNNAKTPLQWRDLCLKFDDDKVKTLCGTDAALYLIFLRESYVFFSRIAVINLFFVFIFILGEPVDKEEAYKRPL